MNSVNRAARAPMAIRVFAALYVTFAVAAFANNMSMLDGFQHELDTAAGTPMPQWTGLFGFGLRLMVRLILAWFVFVRASKFAGILILLFALPWFWQALAGFPALLGGDLVWARWAVVFFLQITALVCLLTPSARVWFSRRGRTIAQDVDEFA